MEAKLLARSGRARKSSRAAAPVAPLLHAWDRVDRLFRRRTFGDPPNDRLAPLAGSAAADAARAALDAALDAPLLERAMGVIYRPRAERQSHSVFARVGRQSDGRYHVDRPRAVEPRDRNAPDVAFTDAPPDTDPTAL